MKKLLLILSAILVSVMSQAQDNDDTGLAYTLNPYAYDLSSSWDASTKKLTVRFTLNAVPNLNGDSQNSVTDGEPNGIQIYAVDPSGNRYRIGGPGRNVIQDAHVNKKGQYVLELDLSSGLTVGGTNPGQKIPDDVPLTWEVRVKGRSKRATTMTCTNAGWRPYHTHGVAVSKNKDSKHFGKIFVTEFSDTKPTDWSWLNNRVPGLLEYDPIKLTSTTTADQAVGHKGGTGLEPHRVRISEDGRIFVTSYPYTSSPSQTGTSTAVWELVNGTYKPIITCDASGTGRVVAMDVKGSGPNLKMLVCELIPYQGKYSSGLERGQLRIREYSIGTSTASQVITEGSQIITYNDYRSDSGKQGIIYQAYSKNYLMAKEGMVNIAYGAGNAIWLKLGFNFGGNINQRIVYFDRSNPCSGHYDTGSTTSYNGMRATPTYISGGDGLLIQGDTLITAGLDNVYLYKIDPEGTLSSLTSVSTVSGTFHATNNWVNDFAIDPAHNLYAVSANARNLMVVSLPYSGSVTTPAPAGNTFVLSDPIPNILATDLRCDIVRGKNQYEFSFNVNTKPEEAQIRFYESYEDMQKSLNVVNADDYDGTNENKPVYVYNIPADTLKQGRIAVNLGAVGGQVDANGEITNNRLPAGVLYWSVYVKTRKSSVFAPIYKQGTTGEDIHYRLHATVNNYPETDGFGHIYAVNYHSKDYPNNGLMVYGFNPGGNCDDEQSYISNSTRYKLVNNYVNSSGSKPKFENQRRLAVAPDGKVYIADHGLSNFDANAIRPMMFSGGGIYVWDPKSQTGNEIVLQQFLKDKTETSSGVAIWNHGGNLKLYGLNTYGEFEFHTGKGGQETPLKWNGYEYTPVNQDNNIYGWNGFKEYALGTLDSIFQTETSGTVQQSLGAGDAGGNISIVAMDKGVWLAQHRDNDVQYTIDQFNKNNSSSPALPDNPSNYILSFVPYDSNSRTWTSCTDNGITYSGSNYAQPGASELTQLLTSPLQSCPGAGLAYRKTTDKEYLYIVNHTGDIVELLIDEWSGNTPTVVYNKTYTSSYTKGTNAGGRPSGAITSMSFDYAGNLITTSGQSYFGSGQDIIVYTMPYDRVNAREIQAPNSYRMIPERIAHLDMDKEGLKELITEHRKDHPSGCAIDLFRPLQGDMFNTICLPFTLDLKTLPEDHPLKNATLKHYIALRLNTVGGEKVLELVFDDVPTENGQQILEANKPYIIQPKDDYNSIIRFAGPLILTDTVGNEDTHDADSYSITYKGIIPPQEVTPTIQDGVSLTLMLVADNRLAELTTQSLMYGFRGYFLINQPLPQGTQSRLSFSRPTATGLINVDGKLINVQKYLQEGRIYIRLDDQVYDLTGARVQ